MENLKIFENEEFGNVRTMTIDEKPYFCGSDIAKALGYSNPQKAIRDHCKGVNEMDTPTNGGIQKIKFITEGDIYRLIVKSKLPSAERFESWVMDEVLPQIRQTGGYIPVNEVDDEMTILSKALLIAQNTLEKKDKLITEQKKYIDDNKDNIIFANAITNDDNSCVDMGGMAKILQNKGLFEKGRNTLIKDLKYWKVLMDNGMPYQAYMNYFKVVVTYKGEKEYTKTLVNTKGQKWIIKGYTKIKEGKENEDNNGRK